MVDSKSSSRSDDDRVRAHPHGAPVLDTEVLFGDGREVILVHKGEQYRLRVTQNGKLILTK